MKGSAAAAGQDGDERHPPQKRLAATSKAPGAKPAIKVKPEPGMEPKVIKAKTEPGAESKAKRDHKKKKKDSEEVSPPARVAGGGGAARTRRRSSRSPRRAPRTFPRGVTSTT